MASESNGTGKAPLKRRTQRARIYPEEKGQTQKDEWFGYTKVT